MQHETVLKEQTTMSKKTKHFNQGRPTKREKKKKQEQGKLGEVHTRDNKQEAKGKELNIHQTEEHNKSKAPEQTPTNNGN